MTTTVSLRSDLLVVAVVAVLGSGAGAYAGPLITGADVKDGSLTGRDIRAGSVRAADLAGDVRDPLQRIGHFKRYTVMSAPVAEGETGYVSFTCPAGNAVRAIGAGGQWEQDEGIDTVDVAPDDGTDSSWHAQGLNSDGPTDRLVLSVTCGRVAYDASDE